MDSRSIRLLEFPRMLEKLSCYAQSRPGEYICQSIRPLKDRDQLQRQIALLEQAQRYSREIMSCSTSFFELEGVFEYLKQGRMIEEEGLNAIKTNLNVFGKAREVLNGFQSELAPDLIEFFQSPVWPQKVWQGVNRCLDQEGEIKDQSSPELSEVRQQIRDIHKKLTQKVTEYLEQEKFGSFLQEDYFTISADRYVLALKSNFKGKISGIIHDYSQSGETCYFEPMVLVELNNRLQELRKKEDEAKREVLWYLSSLVEKELRELQAVYNWLVQLDVLRAKIALAEKMDARTLDCAEDNTIYLKQARHPLLCLEQTEVVPVDICLHQDQKGLIISGGNSGGKTVCLKALGLIALMSLSALAVPVQKGCTLPFWEDIFVFLGDEQSLQDHLSTFTAQIEYFSRSWESMNSQSLVLLDEFGSGTDPSQGAALAQSVMDWLSKHAVWFAAATHFPALKAYAMASSWVRAASVLFDPQTLKPLYKLTYDQVGASQALDVAREYHLPPEILQKAQEYLLLEGQESSNLLNRLNKLAVNREEELKSLKSEQEELEKEKKRVKENYAQKAEDLISEVRQTSGKILKEWREGKLGRKKALKAFSDAKKQARQLDTEQEKEFSPEWESLEPGQYIYCYTWDKFGNILEKDQKNAKLKVNLGGVNIWLAPKEIQVQNKTGLDNSALLYRKTNQQTSGLILDIRGFLPDEAESELNRFLDQALIQGSRSLKIIHGRGTGILRWTVQNSLRDFAGIQNYYSAPEDRGGDGVTIVELD